MIMKSDADVEELADRHLLFCFIFDRIWKMSTINTSSY